MKKKIKFILIVGGTGFLGSNIARSLLNKKNRIFSISTKPPKKERKLKNVKYLICDISNKKKLTNTLSRYKKFDYVLNFGGNVNHKDKKETFKSHYIGCKNLVEIMIKKNIKRFIQIGSSVEYGRRNSPQSEKFFPKLKNLKSIYGKSKLKSTKLMIHYFNKFNFPVSIIRPYLIYGPGQDLNRIIPITISACLKRKNFPCSEGNQLRDFLYIDDFIKLIKKFLVNKKDLNGEIFNVGSGRPVIIKKAIKKIVKKVGHGKPDFGKINLKKDEILKMYPNISKIRKYTGWKPYINFEKGLARTILFYEKKLNI